MITLEKLFIYLKPESFNEIIAGQGAPGGSSGGVVCKSGKSSKSGKNAKSGNNKSSKNKSGKNNCGWG